VSALPTEAAQSGLQRPGAHLTPAMQQQRQTLVVAGLSARSLSSVANTDLSRPSASVASSDKSANAISGSIIQNSARWREVLEFSARNVGPKV